MTAPPRVAFVLEQTLGHVAHGDNLRRLVPTDKRVEAHFLPVTVPAPSGWDHLPGAANWTVRAGLSARRAVAGLRRTHRIDALFIHTQVPAVLCADLIGRIPTVVSVDATPRQYDDLGAAYGHRRGRAASEHLKWRANRAALRRAAAVVAWSRWAADALTADYGVEPERIRVISPGVDVDHWRSVGEADPAGERGPVRLLFVGGDFERKGGPELIAAATRLRDAGLDVELDLVTAADVPARPGVRVHHGLRPHSAELMACYRRADVFCLPTRGDCLPLVLAEAGAARLPLVATGVGAVTELVRDGETGVIVPVGDADALTRSLAQLVTDPTRRRRLGDAAHALTIRDHDAARNARRLVDTLVEAATRPATRGVLTHV